MEEIKYSEIPQEERFMALLCHFIGGFFFSVIIFFVNKKSKFLKFHSLQSLIFLFPIFLISCFSFYLMFIPIDEMRLFIGKNLFLSSMLVIPIGITILISLYSYYVGIPAFRGETKRYPIVGDWAYRKVYGYVEVSEPKELNISQIDIPSSDEKLMSFVTYVAALTTLVIPVIFIFFIYKKKSRFIAYNSLQIIYGFIVFTILIYIPYSIISAFLGFDITEIYPDIPIVNSFLSDSITEIMFSLVGIAFIVQSFKALKGQISKFPILGNLAYHNIYNTLDKTSFNLKNHSSPPPKKQSAKGMV